MLLDLKLPGVNGLEVLRENKTNEKLPTMTIVMVTSSAEDPEIKLAYELGANSYVVKPVKFDTFSEEMSNVGHYWLFINQYPG